MFEHCLSIVVALNILMSYKVDIYDTIYAGLRLVLSSAAS